MKEPTIVIDTREQKPFDFPRLKVIRKKLEVGDYSVRGLEKRVVIERKSFDDLFSSIIYPANETRLKDEFSRALVGATKVYFVMEASVEHIIIGHPRTKAVGRLVLEHVMSLCHGYGVVPVFGGSREGAKQVTTAILRAHFKENK